MARYKADLLFNQGKVKFITEGCQAETKIIRIDPPETSQINWYTEGDYQSISSNEGTLSERAVGWEEKVQALTSASEKEDLTIKDIDEAIASWKEKYHKWETDVYRIPLREILDQVGKIMKLRETRTPQNSLQVMFEEARVVTSDPVEQDHYVHNQIQA